MKKKISIAAIVVLILAIAAVLTSQFFCCGSDVPMAPIYAYAMLESTEVTWELDGDQIGGNAIINHNGTPSHSYSVIMSIVSDSGQKFIASTAKGQIDFHNQHIRRYGWSDMNQSIRDTIDWPTARVWCEIRIYDEDGTVVFHGIKRSGLYSEALRESEAVDESAS